jgi:uncharacterized lipoprotein YehR (DUF1307 family)
MLFAAHSMVDVHKMMQMKKLIVAIAAVFILTNCTNQHKKDLPGEWQGVEILEKGRPLDLNAEEVKFWFGSEERYRFQGTLNYREAGTYYLQSQYLYTTDTVNQASTEKAVEIVKLTEDSLFLKMHEAGKERLMKLKKVH